MQGTILVGGIYLLSGLIRYQKRYKNFLSVIMHMKSNDYPFVAVHRDDSRSVTIHNKNELYADTMSLRYDISSDIVTLPEYNIRFYNGISNGEVYNIFYNKHYEFLALSCGNRIVVDIGANIGDSSIYFGIIGAKKVIALEPFIKNYEIAKKNVAMNNLTDKVELLHAGCSSEQKTAIVDSSKDGVYASINERNSNGVATKLLTLGDIVNRYFIESALLKVDCEGCEYDIVLKSPKEVLDKFTHIQIEYHYGYEKLKAKLEKYCFKVNVTKPQKKKNGMRLGWMYASKMHVGHST
jgi:FkbM family methyltransferase